MWPVSVVCVERVACVTRVCGACAVCGACGLCLWHVWRVWSLWSVSVARVERGQSSRGCCCPREAPQVPHLPHGHPGGALPGRCTVGTVEPRVPSASELCLRCVHHGSWPGPGPRGHTHLTRACLPPRNMAAAAPEWSIEARGQGTLLSGTPPANAPAGVSRPCTSGSPASQRCCPGVKFPTGELRTRAASAGAGACGFHEDMMVKPSSVKLGWK